MTRICLVSHNSAGAFGDGIQGHIGGVERQTALLAEWLVDKGHQVSVITWAEYPGQQDEKIGSLTLLHVCARSEGLPIVRFFWPRWSSLIRALRRANADVIVQNVAESETGQVGMWARCHGARYVYMVASELECEKNLLAFSSQREKILFAMGLRRADTILAQTEAQRRKLRDHWNLDSTTAPMPCAPPEAVDRNRHKGRSCPILWVGRIDPIKRLEFLLDAASLQPDLRIQVIGEFDRSSDYGRRLLDRSAGLANVELLGRKTYAEVWRHYGNASILVCTSKFEGFPNTFLEAMYFGMPIVSTYDPDGIISSRGLGAFVTSPQELVDNVIRLNEDAAEYEATSVRCKDYFDAYHAAPKALTFIEKCILGPTQRG